MCRAKRGALPHDRRGDVTALLKTSMRWRRTCGRRTAAPKQRRQLAGKPGPVQRELALQHWVIPSDDRVEASSEDVAVVGRDRI